MTAPPSREAEIAARLETAANCNSYALMWAGHDYADDLRYLLAQLQQAHNVIVGWTETHAASSKLWRERLAASEAQLQQARQERDSAIVTSRLMAEQAESAEAALQQAREALVCHAKGHQQHWCANCGNRVEEPR